MSNLTTTEETETAQRSSSAQQQTSDAFGFKWSLRETYSSPAVLTEARRWLLEKYFDGSEQRLAELLPQDGPSLQILDAGCGSAVSALALFGPLLARHAYLGVDISSAVDVARERFAEAGIPGSFLRANLMDIPIPDGMADVIFSEGVLHHTDDTGAAVAALAPKLKPGGKFFFYVYRKKADIREFTDDHVRSQLAPMNDEQAWEALKPLTELGIALGKLGGEITVPSDVPQLGIKAGTYSLQRFFYYNICKAFYRDDYAFDEMHHINFDWYRPLNCHRHTSEEVEEFCRKAGLKVARLHVGNAGISVIATK